MELFRRSPLCLLTLATVLGLGLAGCGDDETSGTGTGDGFGGDGVPTGDGGGDAGDDGSTGGGDEDGDETTGEEGGTGTGSDEAACEDQEDTVLYLSPDDSNSMSSPVQVREAILSGWSSLSAVPIRTWEFLNYYSFDYPAAEANTVGLFTQMATPPELDADEYLLQIGVSSEVMTDAQRPPLNITLVLDESGSMSGQPIDMLKEVCRAIAASLKQGDKISMVTWDVDNNILLGGYEVDGPNDEILLDKIEAISAGGGTNLAGGLTTGYELAQEVWDAERINRIVLVSDGGANVGVTSEQLIGERAGGQNEDGIYMVGVGVGSASTYNDLLMDVVTDAGKGASVFVPNQAEAWTIFNQNFVNTLAVAARDVQVELTMPPGFEIVTFSGEEYSEDPEEVEPQHLAPNDAMVFHQRIKTCAPELATDDAEITVTARFKDGVTFEEREVSETKTFAELLGGDQAMLLKGAAIFAYAEALKTMKFGPRDDALNVTIEDALVALANAEEALPGDTDLAEIREVLEAL